jgi:hypothetical protein
LVLISYFFLQISRGKFAEVVIVAYFFYFCVIQFMVMGFGVELEGLHFVLETDADEVAVLLGGDGEAVGDVVAVHAGRGSYNCLFNQSINNERKHTILLA